MGQIGVSAIVPQDAGRPVMADRSRQIIGVITQVIVLAGDQHTGRQIHGHGHIVGIQVRIKGVLFVILSVERFWKEQSDAVLPGGIEHAADECQGHDLQVRGPDTGCFGKSGIALDGGCVHGKHGACAVAYHIAVAKLRFQLRHQAVNVVHGCVDILQLLEHGHLRAQTVLYGKNEKSHLAEVDAEMPVELLVSHDEAAAMDIDDHRCRDLDCCGTVHVHHVRPVTVALIADVMLLPDAVQDLYRDAPSGGKLLEIPALLIDDRFEYPVHRVSFHKLQDISACLRMHKGDRSVR